MHHNEENVHLPVWFISLCSEQRCQEVESLAPVGERFLVSWELSTVFLQEVSQTTSPVNKGPVHCIPANSSCFPCSWYVPFSRLRVTPLCHLYLNFPEMLMNTFLSACHHPYVPIVKKMSIRLLSPVLIGLLSFYFSSCWAYVSFIFPISGTCLKISSSIQ